MSNGVVRHTTLFTGRDRKFTGLTILRQYPLVHLGRQTESGLHSWYNEQARVQTIQGSIPGRAENNCLLAKTSRPDAGPTQSSVVWVPATKRSGRDVNHSRSSSANVRNEWSYASLLHLHGFMACIGTAKCAEYRRFVYILILIYFNQYILVVQCLILNIIILHVASTDKWLLPAMVVDCNR